MSLRPSRTSPDSCSGLMYSGVPITNPVRAGLVINLGTYFLLVLRTEYFAAHPLVALWAGGSLAIVSNFLGSKLWAFRHPRRAR